ncbi:Cell wall surface anchor family protein [Bacillus thuringiensis serovar pondicheriensis BGSC 4BA1]|nr:Cell wall surface anchor family protein [Bacillus thuringiensis serovar pondicheriensis BGSC 4BA1]
MIGQRLIAIPGGTTVVTVLDVVVIKTGGRVGAGIKEKRTLSVFATISFVKIPSITTLNWITTDSSGSITVNQSGTYAIDARVQTDVNSGTGEFVVSINGSNSVVPYFNHVTTQASSTSELVKITTIIILNAGDTLAIRNVGSNTVALLPDQPSAEELSPTGALRFISLNDLSFFYVVFWGRGPY